MSFIWLASLSVEGVEAVLIWVLGGPHEDHVLQEVRHPWNLVGITKGGRQNIYTSY